MIEIISKAAQARSTFTEAERTATDAIEYQVKTPISEILELNNLVPIEYNPKAAKTPITHTVIR